ncbi:hypothetical protein [Streptomyces rishiriensis]
MTGKIEQVRDAQEDGRLDVDWDPVDILLFVPPPDRHGPGRTG